MFTKIKIFIEEVLAELKKVNWTPRRDLINTTFVVIVASICLGLFITLSDLLLSRGLNVIIR
jgi:preprotein translocase subunit SecE